MVEIGFYSLSALMLLSPFLFFKEKRLRLIYALGALIWVFYLVVIANTEVLETTDLPARVPLFIVVPVIIIMLVFTAGASVKEAIAKIPRSLAVYMQSFRICVELLIYGAFVNGVFPEAVTFEGRNFDILVGVSALVIGFFIQRGKISWTGVLAWNVISLLILASTVYAFISTYYFSGMHNEVVVQFVNFPYLLLASILLPFAVFYHIISLRQLASISK